MGCLCSSRIVRQVRFLSVAVCMAGLALAAVMPCAGQAGSGPPAQIEEQEGPAEGDLLSSRAERDRRSLLEGPNGKRDDHLTVVPGRFLNDRTEKIMQQMVDRIIFDDTPFSDVIRELEARYGVSMLLDRSATEDSLDEDTTVSVDLAGVSLERGLSELLYPHNATFIVSDGIVKVISKDVAEDTYFFERRVFDCAALAGKLPKRLKDRILRENMDAGESVSPSAAEAANDAPAQPGPVFPTVLVNNTEQGALGGDGGPAVPPRPEMTTLEELVSAVVDPDEWSRTGNGDAEIYELNGRLIVFAAGPMVREVRDFLEHLKAEFGVEE